MASIRVNIPNSSQLSFKKCLRIMLERHTMSMTNNPSYKDCALDVLSGSIVKSITLSFQKKKEPIPFVKLCSLEFRFCAYFFSGIIL